MPKSESIETTANQTRTRAPVWYKKRAVWWVAILVVGGLSLVGWRGLRGSAVTVVRPVRGELVHKVVSTGRVMAPARIQLGSTAIGKVARVNADEGDAVQAGQVLIELVDAEQRAAVAQAQAVLMKAGARLGQIKKGTRRAAAALVEESRSAHEQAVREDERAKLLFQSGAAPQQQVDQVKRALDAASSRLLQAEISYESAGPGGSDLSQSSAGLLEADAALQAARARLEQMRIEAPTHAVVLQRDVEPGDVVQPGRTLMLLARSGPAELTVQADEKNLAVLRVGQRAVASADALPDQPFDARVAFIAPAVDAERGTIEVRLSVPNPPQVLRPDMTVSVNIEVGRRTDAVALDEQALRDLGTDRPWVLVVRDGRAQRRDVTVGIRGDGKVEIIKGLDVNDQVILRDGSSVTPGNRVHPIPMEHENAV